MPWFQIQPRQKKVPIKQAKEQNSDYVTDPNEYLFMSYV